MRTFRPGPVLLSAAALVLVLPAAAQPPAQEWQRRAATLRYLQQRDGHVLHALDRLLDVRGRLPDAPLWQDLRSHLGTLVGQRAVAIEAAGILDDHAYQEALRPMADLQAIRRFTLERILDRMRDRDPHPDPVAHLALAVALVQELDHFRQELDPDPAPADLESHERHAALLAAWWQQADQAFLQQSTGQPEPPALDACRLSWEAWRQLRPELEPLMRPRIRRCVEALAAEADHTLRNLADEVLPLPPDDPLRAARARFQEDQQGLAVACQRLRVLAEPADSHAFQQAWLEALEARARIAQSNLHTHQEEVVEATLAQVADVGANLALLDQNHPVQANNQVMRPLVQALEARTLAYRNAAERWSLACRQSPGFLPKPAELLEAARATHLAHAQALAQQYVWGLPEDQLNLRQLEILLACGRAIANPAPATRAQVEGLLPQCERARADLAARIRLDGPVTLGALLEASQKGGPLAPDLLHQATVLLGDARALSVALAANPHLDLQVRELGALAKRLARLQASLADHQDLAAALGQIHRHTLAALNHRVRMNRLATLHDRGRQLALRASLREWVETTRARALAVRAARTLAADLAGTPRLEELQAVLEACEHRPELLALTGAPRLQATQALAERALSALHLAAGLQTDLAPRAAPEVRVLFQNAARERLRRWREALAALRRDHPELQVLDAAARHDELFAAAQERIGQGGPEPARQRLTTALVAFADGIATAAKARPGQDADTARLRLDETLRPETVAALFDLEGAQEQAGLQARERRFAALEASVAADTTLAPELRQRLLEDLAVLRTALAERMQVLAQDPGADLDLVDPLLAPNLRFDASWAESCAWKCLQGLVHPDTSRLTLRDLETCRARAAAHRGALAAQAELLARLAYAVQAGLGQLPPAALEDPAALWQATGPLRQTLAQYLALRDELVGRL